VLLAICLRVSSLTVNLPYQPYLLGLAAHLCTVCVLCHPTSEKKFDYADHFARLIIICSVVAVFSAYDASAGGWLVAGGCLYLCSTVHFALCSLSFVYS
jgi:hypothetical protein